jgi:hypothetical protein
MLIGRGSGPPYSKSLVARNADVWALQGHENVKELFPHLVEVLASPTLPASAPVLRCSCAHKTSLPDTGPNLRDRGSPLILTPKIIFRRSEGTF